MGVLVMSSAVSAIFSLYDRWGGEHYIGENVTQLQHAQQAAEQAEKAGYGEKVIIGAFLRDIGHLIGMEKDLPLMEQNGVPLGTVEHDAVGENFLRDLGFPVEVTQFVRGHVQEPSSAKEDQCLLKKLQSLKIFQIFQQFW